MFEAADDIVVKLLAVFFVGRLKLGHGGRVRFVELFSYEWAFAKQPLCVSVDFVELFCVPLVRIKFFAKVRDVVFSRLAKRCARRECFQKLVKRLACQWLGATFDQRKICWRVELQLGPGRRDHPKWLPPDHVPRR